MSDIWREDIFDNLVRLKRGYDLPNQNIVEGGYPVVASSQIKAYHNNSKVEPPIVVTGRSGTLGKVQYIQEPCWPLNTTLYSKSFRDNCPKYVYYFLKQMNLENYNAGAGVPTLNQNHLQKIKIKIPSLVTQERIAAILSSYDDLIEANKKRIHVLEDMVEELYKEWFVRFRFPNWESTKFMKGTPEGWEFRKLTEISDITYGYAFDSSRFSNECVGKKIVRIRNIPESMSLDFTDEVVDDRYIIRNGDFLIGMDGIFHMNRWYDGESYLVQRTCRISAKSKVFQAYLRLAMKAPISFYQATILGATVGHLGAKHLNEVVIILPSEEYLPLLGRLNNIDELILEIELTNRNLEAQRDNLLPRLISGELSVAELDIHYPPSMQANYEATDN